jgi:hypothetical protein
MAPDLLATIRAEIDARLRELRPVIEEHERLLSAADALFSEGSSVVAPGPTRAPIVAAAPARGPARGRGRPRRGSAAGAIARVASAPDAAPDAALGGVPAPEKTASPVRPRERAPRGAAGEAIVAALEHGSHTVAELVVVTALPAAAIRHDARRLLKRHAIVKIDRDGKTAYALPAPAA